MPNELAFETDKAAFETARQMLTDGHYVVMLSREEQLWIVNYEYSNLNNRNDMVFMSREEFEEKFVEVQDESRMQEAEHD